MQPPQPVAEQFAALVLRVARDRDREAFVRLFDHFAPRLNSYLLRLGADPAQAEELVQDTMATLWRKAELFDGSKSSVGTWLYRIARNRRIDLLRRGREDELDEETSNAIIDTAAAPDEVLDGVQLQSVVRLSMSCLPNEQLDLIRLAFFEGLSHTEIADRTGLPLGTVKSRIRLAFARLRREIEAKGVAAPR